MSKENRPIDKPDDWHDPLAVEVGLGVGVDDLPSDGWPKEYRPEVIKRVLGYLSVED